jgi:murein DD-endopeptidase MepM/ murein hydrolase activator NlpD
VLPRRAVPAGILPVDTDGYVFPVVGTPSYGDDYGAPRAVTEWHHGNDLFAPTGTPILAVADGTLFSVGVNTLGGNRLWLRDERGNTFYYAHLSAYAPAAIEGAKVQAGEVIGFMGNTGQAITTPPHLHFEIHPADGDSVNPYPYLLAWQRRTDVPLAFRAAEVADGQAPASGVLVVSYQVPDEAPEPDAEGLAEIAP